ncbi:LysR family transcriptional regulator [Stakelama sp. CBK3Z-3]|uniref:LysR family transcriptional regulator n=1 Tax=Stakelama flava TaxID=2860338 RepID=A0ABS6XLW7_9SPHN|nr:LysR family transcriptional regulator [Stakelama flava]MBW4330793.1 LysR family transcriptional regulator [Stakelama flava]
MRWRIDDLIMFCAVVDAGGISAAAAKLECPKSSVSKALARLERDVGLLLIERTSRRMRVTPEGEAFHARAAVILELAEEADALAQGLRTEPAGQVTLSLPAAFCREIFAPRLNEFAEAYPEIALELVVPSRGGLGSDECDMAVVGGPQPDSTLMQKVLLGGRLLWVASPDFAAKHKLTDAPPSDFGDLKIYESRFAGTSISLNLDGIGQRLALPSRGLRANDPLTVREAVKAGLGVSFLPERYCETALREGTLVEVWERVQFAEEAARLAVVFPGSRLLSPRFRAVINFLDEICHRPDAKASAGQQLTDQSKSRGASRNANRSR